MSKKGECFLAFNSSEPLAKSAFSKILSGSKRFSSFYLQKHHLTPSGSEPLRAASKVSNRINRTKNF